MNYPEINRFIEAPGLIVVVLDSKGCIKKINNAACDVLGFTKDDLLGSSWFDTCIPERMRADVTSTFDDIVQGRIQDVDIYENPVLTADGTEKSIQWHNIRIQNDDGAFECAVSYGVDVTDRNKAAAALRESESNYRSLFDNSPIGIYRTTPDGRMLMANKVMSDMFKYSSPSELLSLNLQENELYVDNTRSSFVDEIEREGLITDREWRCRCKDGTIMYIRENAKAVREDGRTVYYEGTCEDITERVKIKESLDWHIEFEKLITRIATEFMCVSHDKLQGCMEDAVKTLSEFMEMDRGYIYEPDRVRGVYYVTCEWAAEGIDKVSSERGELKEGDWNWSEQYLYEGKNILNISSLDDLPPEAEKEKNQFSSEDVQSVIIVPLVCGDRVEGIIGFESIWKEKKWQEDTLTLLEVAGEIFASAIERKRASANLAEKDQMVDALMNNLPDSIYFKDLESRFIRVNKAFLEKHYSKAENKLDPIGKTDYDFFDKIHADDARANEKMIIETGEPIAGKEEREIWQDGSETWTSVTKAPLKNGQGEIIGTFGISRDITKRKMAEKERRRMEAQMLHAQKLESLGVLSGGIAHDFNNLLMGILGNAGLALLELTPDSPAWNCIKQIETVALRAAELTNQMLEYSGKSESIMKQVNMTGLVREMTHLLGVSIPKSIDLLYDFNDDLPSVKCDPVQLRQVVMNLITNAADAIGDDAGRITVGTGITRCDEDYLSGCYIYEDLLPGDYIYVEVADTGAGMTKEIQAKIFDPFFTTKIQGHGLGLASVLGIVRSHCATLKVYSEPGKGTNIKILLPCAGSGGQVEMGGESDEVHQWSGEGRVLLIDDDEVVCMVTKRILQRLGFETVTALGAKEAIGVFESDKKELKTVLMDITLPDGTCSELMAKMGEQGLDAPVILMSGYKEADATDGLPDGCYAGFLQKPFSAEALARLLKDVTS